MLVIQVMLNTAYGSLSSWFSLNLTVPALLLSGVLVRNFSSVVFTLASSMVDGWKDDSVGGRIASKLVGHELPRWPTLLFQDLAKEALSGPLVSATGDQCRGHHRPDPRLSKDNDAHRKW
jgi:hypothetical protein